MDRVWGKEGVKESNLRSCLMLQKGTLCEEPAATRLRTNVVRPLVCFSHAADDPNLLNMAEGEVLDIIEEDSGDGWTRVRRSDNTEGYVPTSYITVS